MTTLQNKLRKQLTIRPSILAICVLALGSLLVGPAVGSGTSTSHKVTMLLDDINDVALEDDLGMLPDMGTGVDSDNGGDTSGTVGGGSGHDNNGHGNNTDGVDSSNPGQGHGGPNGGVDASCPDGSSTCVDDEAGTGGGNGHGNGVGNGNGHGRP